MALKRISMFMLFALGVLCTASAENRLSKKTSEHQKMLRASDEPTVRILVVDDAPVMRTIEKNQLNQLGYQNVDEASDGASAWTQLQQNPDISLVLTDLDMPGMNGIELLQKIRSAENTKSIPVIMVSTELEKEAMMTAIKAGVNYYLFKPFTAATLSDGINRVLS